MAAAALALVWANSPFAHSYHALWERDWNATARPSLTSSST
ncbi:hypothetical protein [Burkholderia sp. Ac-20365]|nr:hypothetical protein [Burkholderia sp. Ac-20365]